MLNITQRTIIDRMLKEKNKFIDFVTEETKNPELKTYKDYAAGTTVNHYSDATVDVDPTDIILADETLRKMYDRFRESLAKDDNIKYLKEWLNQKRKEIQANRNKIDVNEATKEIDEIESLINKSLRESKEREYASSSEYNKSILALLNYILEKNNIPTLIEDDKFDYDKEIIQYYKQKRNNPELKRVIAKYEKENEQGISIEPYDLLVVANGFLSKINSNKEDDDQSITYIDNRDIDQLVSYLNKNAGMKLFGNEKFMSEYRLLISNIEERIGHISHILFESALKAKISEEKDGTNYFDYLDQKSALLALKRKEIQKEKNVLKGTIPLTKNLIINIQVDKKTRRKEKRKLILDKKFGRKVEKFVSPEVEEYKNILTDITRKISDKKTTFEEIENCKLCLLCIETTDPAIRGKVYRLLGKINVRLHSYDKEIGKLSKQITALGEWSQEVSSYNHLEVSKESALKREMARYSDAVCVLRKMIEDKQEQLVNSNSIYNQYKAAKDNYKSMVSYASKIDYFKPTASTTIASKSISSKEEIREFLLDDELKNNGLLYYKKNNKNELKDAFVVDGSNFRLSSIHRSEDNVVRSPIAISIEDAGSDKVLSVYVINSAPFMTEETIKYLEEMYYASLKDTGVLRNKDYVRLSKQFYFDDNCTRPAIEYRFVLDENNHLKNFSVEQCDVQTREVKEEEKDYLREIYMMYRQNAEESLEHFLEKITSVQFYKYADSIKGNLPILCTVRFHEYERVMPKKQAKNYYFKNAQYQMIEKIGTPLKDMPSDKIREISKEYYENKLKTHFRTKDFVDNDPDGYYEYNKLNVLHPYIFTNYFNQSVINCFIFGNTEIGRPKYFYKKQEQYAEKFNIAMGIIDCDTQVRLMQETIENQKQYKIGSI